MKSEVDDPEEVDKAKNLLWAFWNCFMVFYILDYWKFLCLICRFFLFLKLEQKKHYKECKGQSHHGWLEL